MCDGGIRTSTTETSGVCCSTASTSDGPSPTAATTSWPFSVKQPDQTLPQQDRVVCHHDSQHGSSTLISVGPPAGLTTVSAPPVDSDPVDKPAQAVALGDVRTAIPVVDDLHRQPAGPVGDRHPAVRRTAVLGDIGQSFGDGEVRGVLDGSVEPTLRQAEIGVDHQFDGDGAPAGECGQRAGQAAIGEHRWRDPARECA